MMRSVRRGGWLAALAVGLLLAGGWVRSDSAPEQAAALPPDLARVPADGVWMASVRLADVWAGDLGKGARQGLGKAEAAALERDFARAFGLPMGQVERWTVVFPRHPAGGQPLLFFVAARVPLGADQVRKVVGPDAREEKVGGHTYHVGADRALHRIRDRAFVVALPSALREYLSRPVAGQGGGLAPAVRQAAGRHLAVCGVNIQPIAAQEGNNLPAALKPFRALLEARSAVLTADGGQPIRLNLRVQFASDKDAGTGAKVLGAAVQLGQVALGQVVTDLRNQKGMAAFADLLEKVEAGLKDTAVRQDRTTVRAGLDLDVSPAVLGRVGIGAVRRARADATRHQSMNNLKQMALAMHNYHDAYGTLPPHAIFGKDGKPLLSWRVLLLPFLDENKLYKEFHLDEPWDSAHNKKLLARMPHVYRAPVPEPKPDQTVYQVFVGKGTVFEGTRGIRLTQIFDGTSNTLMIVEAARTVPWTKPEDLPYRPDKPLPKLGGVVPGGFNAAFGDGSVRFINAAIKEKILRLLITRDDGQVIPAF